MGGGQGSERAERLVALGYVARAHGVRGELRVERFHAGSDTLLVAARVALRPRGGGAARTFGVERAQAAGKAVLVCLAGVEGREAAEALVGHEVLVPRSALPEPADGEVYLCDLVGLEAREGERVLGRVVDVVHHPASDCACVATERGTVEIPLGPPYLLEVDLRDGVLRLAHTEDFEPARSAEPGAS